MAAPLGIGFDLDGVLANFNSAMLARLNARNKADGLAGFADCPNTFATWHWGVKHFGPEVYREEWNKLTPEWWEQLHGYQPAHVCAAINRLCQTQRVHFVTHRPDYAYDASQRWLERELQLPASAFTLACVEKKGAYAAAQGLSVFVEDKPENLLDVLAQCGDACTRILVRQPWNSAYHDHPAFHAVDTVREALQVITWHL